MRYGLTGVKAKWMPDISFSHLSGAEAHRLRGRDRCDPTWEKSKFRRWERTGQRGSGERWYVLIVNRLGTFKVVRYPTLSFEMPSHLLVHKRITAEHLLTSRRPMLAVVWVRSIQIKYYSSKKDLSRYLGVLKCTAMPTVSGRRYRIRWGGNNQSHSSNNRNRKRPLCPK